MIASTRRFRSLALALAAVSSIAACSTGGAATTSPTSPAATSGPVATTAGGPAATDAGGGTATTAAGGTKDFCSLFTLAQVGTLMGGSTVAVDTTNTQPMSCTWFTPDGATVLMKQDTASTCADDMGLVQSQGQAFIEGSTFEGPAIAGAYIAGTVILGVCYEVVVANGYTPARNTIDGILQEFAAKAQA